MNRFIHVGFGFEGVPKILDLEPIFSDMGDWVRYSNTNWLLWTDMPLNEINAVIRDNVDIQDHYVISGVEGNQISAFVPGWVWDWIIGKMPPNSFSVGPRPNTPKIGPQKGRARNKDI